MKNYCGRRQCLSYRKWGTQYERKISLHLLQTRHTPPNLIVHSQHMNIVHAQRDFEQKRRWVAVVRQFLIRMIYFPFHHPPTSALFVAFNHRALLVYAWSHTNPLSKFLKTNNRIAFWIEVVYDIYGCNCNTNIKQALSIFYVYK